MKSNKAQQDKVESLLSEHSWRYAKTMPEDPHEYSLRENWNDDDFDFVVKYFYKYGELKKFGWKAYRYFYFNNMRYWCMGNPISETTLINRCDITPKTYDDIANYEEIFEDEEYQKENQIVFDEIAYNGGSILDIGCGSGLSLDYITLDEVDDYTGIDSSLKMVQKFKETEIGGYLNIVHEQFENWYDKNTSKRYDYIISLFGSASHLDPKYVKKITNLLKPDGTIFLMFYKDKYVPQTYIKSNTYIPHYKARRIKGLKAKEYFNKYMVYTL